MKFIINPRSKLLKKTHIFKRIINSIRNRFREKDMEFTRGIYHAAEIAQKAVRDGFDTIVSVGGDGTLSEIICGIDGNRINLGIIPTGGGNDFARSVGIKRDPLYNLNNIENSQKRPVDIVKVNDSYFLNVMGTGIDSEVAFNIDPHKNYFKGFYEILRKHEEFLLKINIDGNIHRYDKVRTCIIANGKYFGHNMKISPHSEIDDGSLEVIVVHDISRTKLFFLFPLIYKGRHLGHNGITTFTGRNITIESDHLMLFEKDGEIFKTNKADISVIPGKLDLLIPG